MPWTSSRYEFKTSRSAVRPVNHRSTERSSFDRSITVRPAVHRSTGRSPFDRPVTVGPTGPVRSDLFRPIPVPVVKNPDRFHLWTTLYTLKKIDFQSDLLTCLLFRLFKRVLNNGEVF
jgi:hypothetical protein